MSVGTERREKSKPFGKRPNPLVVSIMFLALAAFLFLVGILQSNVTGQGYVILLGNAAVCLVIAFLYARRWQERKPRQSGDEEGVDSA